MIIEELTEMEGRARAFEESTQTLQKELVNEIEEKNMKLEQLEKEWMAKNSQ